MTIRDRYHTCFVDEASNSGEICSAVSLKNWRHDSHQMSSVSHEVEAKHLDLL